MTNEELIQAEYEKVRNSWKFRFASWVWRFGHRVSEWGGKRIVRYSREFQAKQLNKNK